MSNTVDTTEKSTFSMNGAIALLVMVAFVLAGLIMFVQAAMNEDPARIIPSLTLIALATLLATALVIVNPGEARVIQFFGSYIGTLRKPGLHITIPMTTKRKVSVKVHNFETSELKVNDFDGNPVNIAAIIVWQVADTAKAVFSVEDYARFVAVQSESALRHIASSHPYDNAAPGQETLRGSTDRVASELAAEVAARIEIAGLVVLESRIASLAYAPEIAQVMLQRQQAAAVIAAREKIVEGAVSMVQNALVKLDDEGIVTLDDERKAAMVSNLLVVLCSDSRATPIVNAGTLYQ